jgi:hypothetical protein
MYNIFVSEETFIDIVCNNVRFVGSTLLFPLTVVFHHEKGDRAIELLTNSKWHMDAIVQQVLEEIPPRIPLKLEFAPSYEHGADLILALDDVFRLVPLRVTRTVRRNLAFLVDHHVVWRFCWDDTYGFYHIETIARSQYAADSVYSLLTAAE